MKRYENLFYEPLNILEKLPSGNQSEMSKDQLAFLLGLMKEYRPKKLVEIGVAEGGTTVAILQCISILNLETKVISIDLQENLYNDDSRKIGYATEEYLLMQEKCFDYTLYTGKYAPELLKMVEGDIDFLILDTMHKMPGEILDFLACYPFLKKGAVVVLHDIALCHYENNWDAIATKLLFDTVTADKLIGIDEEDSSLLNIGAFVVTEDTGQYIDDVFSALTTIWGYRVKDKELAIYREFYSHYYSEEKIILFDMAVRMNQSTLDRKVNEKICTRQEDFLKIYAWVNKIRAKENVYIYGCGHYGKALFRLLARCGIPIKGYVISDGQDAGECKETIFFLSGIDKCLEKDRDVIVIGVDIPLQAEICAGLSTRGISEYILPDRNILNMLI